MHGPATEPRLVSDSHDMVLALALGALAAMRRFEEAFATPAPSGPPLDAGDPAVFAALGALSFGGTLRRWLEEAGTSAPASAAAAPPATSPPASAVSPAPPAPPAPFEDPPAAVEPSLRDMLR